MDVASLVPLLVGAAIAFGAFLFSRRYGGGAALRELEMANKVLEKRVNELTVQNTKLTAQVATLTGRTDVATAVEPVMRLLRDHEREAAIRSERTLLVLDLIASRLGREDEI